MTSADIRAIPAQDPRSPTKFRALSYAQQQALISVARNGTANVPHAHTNRRTAAKLKALGYIKFDDGRGAYALTELGRGIIPAGYWVLPSADKEQGR